MTNYAIQVQSLGKEYILGGAEQRHDSFREMLTGALLSPFRKLRKLGGSANDEERFWALKEVDFNIKQGEVVGVIGRNGAGKSTLLKILSRITSPTEGRVITRGRIASLLEVGTGFHPELTGRENIYLNGSVLGMSNVEIKRNFDEIVSFAGVEKFIDTPVKRYSSGMSVRLAFSVAAHLEPEILLVDEVLAVGDAEFQKKCLGKMNEVSQRGRTVLFVSHNMGMISKLCTSGIVLDKGKLVFEGDMSKAVQVYLEENFSSSGLTDCKTMGELNSLSFHEMTINGQSIQQKVVVRPHEKVCIKLAGNADKSIEDYRTTVSILKDGNLVAAIHDTPEPESLGKGGFVSSIEIPEFFLSPGDYSINFGGSSTKDGRWLWFIDVAMFSVANEWHPEYDTTANMGLINLPRCGARTRNNIS